MTNLTEFTEVPVVDVAGLLGDDPREQERVAQELGRAAREVGFLQVTGTGIDPALFADLLRVTKAFFDLPHEVKMRTYIGRSRNHRGYVPVGEEVFSGGTVDLKEAFDLGRDLPADDPDHLAGRMLGPNQWPDVQGFAAACTAWYEAVMALGRALLRGFALALGEPADVFDGYVTKPPSQLRLIHYPHDPHAVDTVGIGAHTDYECFTILKPTAPGLEVLNGAGAWVDVPPRPDALVVNIGDMLETWTNGTFVATTHRVRKVTEERWSFPLFFNVDHDTVVAPLRQFVGDGEPVRAPLVAGEHLFAQTAQSFTYLKQRIASGELVLPEGSLALSSFGQEARNVGGVS
jgi:isopenicillin N synthase-like dioxygenase